MRLKPESQCQGDRHWLYSEEGEEGDRKQGTEGEGGLRVRASEEEDIANYDSLFWVLESK